MTAGWRRWLRIWRRSPETDVDAELRFHMEARVDDLVARGLAPDVARAQALEEFGDVEAARAELTAIDRRMARRHTWADRWGGVALDLRHTLRGLARSPGFTVMVVLTLALGIGANAAVFAVLDRLFLAPPAGVPYPDRIQRLFVTRQFPGQPTPQLGSEFSYPEFRSMLAALPASVRAAGVASGRTRIGPSSDAPVRDFGYTVGDYFGVLGLHPVVGRFFSGAETTGPGRTPVAVISHRLWTERFGGTAAVLGQPLDLGPHRYTIVGVAPRGFSGTGLDAYNVWVPFNTIGSWEGASDAAYHNIGTGLIRVVARAPGVRDVAALEAGATAGLRGSHVPWDSTAKATVGPLRGADMPDFYLRQYAISERLAGVAAIILLIACANVANLLLARASVRRRETAVRLALGVSRRRLIARSLAESVVVAVLAGAAALVTAAWTSGVLRALILARVQWGGPSVDLRVGLFAASVSLVAGVAAGIVPAVQASRSDLTEALKSSSRNGSPGRSRTRSALVALQAALSVVLLAGAGLFARSLRSVESIDLGYDAPRLIFASAAATDDSALDREIAARLPALAARVRLVAGVTRTALTLYAPLRGFSSMDTFLPGRDSLPPVGEFRAPIVVVASPGYFATLGMHLLEGRGFTDHDRAGAEPVVVVSRSLARAYWPGQDALGKCLVVDTRTGPCRRVAGVVNDARTIGIVGAPAPLYYLPFAQAPAGWRQPGAMAIRIAERVDPAAVKAAVEGVMRDALGPQANVSVHAMHDFEAPELAQWRLGATLFSGAGLLALIVAAIGIYSSVSYGVSQRTRELGIRLALGARAPGVIGLVVRQGVRAVAFGVLLGILVALALGRLVTSLLYGVSPHDPAVLGATAALLLVVAGLASLLPAHRASHVDPMETLRAE
jgi:putative ABC transport system permease protein